MARSLIVLICLVFSFSSFAQIYLTEALDEYPGYKEISKKTKFLSHDEKGLDMWQISNIAYYRFLEAVDAVDIKDQEYKKYSSARAYRRLSEHDIATILISTIDTYIQDQTSYTNPGFLKSITERQFGMSKFKESYLERKFNKYNSTIDQTELINHGPFQTKTYGRSFDLLVYIAQMDDSINRYAAKLDEVPDFIKRIQGYLTDQYSRELKKVEKLIVEAEAINAQKSFRLSVNFVAALTKLDGHYGVEKAGKDGGYSAVKRLREISTEISLGPMDLYNHGVVKNSFYGFVSKYIRPYLGYEVMLPATFFTMGLAFMEALAQPDAKVLGYASYSFFGVLALWFGEIIVEFAAVPITNMIDNYFSKDKLTREKLKLAARAKIVCDQYLSKQN